MNGAKPADSQPAQSEKSSSERQPLAGPGVSSLLQGRKKNIFAEPAPQPASGQPEIPSSTEIQTPAVTPQVRKKLIPRWYFFAADVALIIFVLVMVAKSPGALGWKEVTFCIAAVALGAVLAAVGISQPPDR